MTTTAPPVATYALPMQRDVAAFHDAFEMPNLISTPGPLPLDRIELRIGLLREEGVVELREAAQNGDVVAVIDALVDTVYVGLGALVEMGRDYIPHSFEISRQPTLNTALLLEVAKGLALGNEMHLVLLERAFNQSDDARSVETISEIVTSALLALRDSGIQIDPFFNEVQRANMSKLGADGRPVKSRGMAEDGYPAGKVLKGPAYRGPDLNLIYRSLHGPKPTADFERGVKAAAESMRRYFVDENDRSIFSVSDAELLEFTAGAVADAMSDERSRLERSS